jgi:hypothetical protein
MSSRLLAIIGILLVITAGVLVWVNMPSTPQQVSHEFLGVVKEVDTAGRVVLLNGLYLVDGKPTGTLMDVRVSFADAVAITRIVHYRPSPAQLQKAGGVWDPSKAPTVTEQKTIADLAGLVGRDLTAHSESNIFGQTSFTASAFSYDDNDWAPADKPPVVK